MIADRLGKNRTAILGIIFRRQLRRITPPSITKTPVERPYRPFAPPSVHPERQLYRLKAMVKSLPAPRPMNEIAHKRDCSFPVSGAGADTLYCGAGTDGQVYCFVHRRIMYQVRAARK